MTAIPGQMTESEFLHALDALLARPVAGLEPADRLAALRRRLNDLEARLTSDIRIVKAGGLRIVPFAPRERPVDEALHPGKGASERVGFVHSGEVPPDERDELWILYELDPAAADPSSGFTVHMRAWLLPHEGGEGEPEPIPRLMDVEVSPQVVSADTYPVPTLEAWSSRAAATARRVAVIRSDDLMRGADGELLSPDPFGFEHLFHRRVRVELSLRRGAERLTAQETEVELYDLSRFGSLYQRILERVVVPDAERQARRAGATELHHGHHPMFPVLAIGSEKARLYLRAISNDLVLQRRNLPDSRWLLRVGVYLELLTCIGLAEALEAEYPEVLTPEERAAYERSGTFARLRPHVNVAAWRGVAELRQIALPSTELLSLGPVSLLNLLRKQKATLAFLHAHHDDLRWAIALAGPNLHDAQETWHRVYRDAERAVLKESLTAFPELMRLDARARQFALWHQRGDLRLMGRYAVPSWLTANFGDQDGVYPSACRSYRDSMNEVASWAAERGLMDFTGEECVPRQASLLEAAMSRELRLLASLQRRDGYGPELEAEELPEPEALAPDPDQVAAMLRRLAVFRPLLEEEVKGLACRARRLVFGPFDRVVQQGEPGRSLFVVESGELEAVVRQSDGRDLVVGTLGPGAVFGEHVLLTGTERSATVKAVRDVVLYEIDQKALRPCIEARPQLLVDLCMLTAARQSTSRERSDDYQRGTEERGRGLLSVMRRAFFG